jgi:protoporphyrinogen/coproporphyrinogen III oxidase
MKVVIVGGGFSGLVTAAELRLQGVTGPITVYEKSHRWGGLLGSRREPWGLVEQAANGFLLNQPLKDFCSRLAIQLCPTQPEQRRRYIFRGSPRRWPLSFSESARFLKGAFSVRLFSGNRPDPGVNLSTWASLKFGPEALEYLIEPAVTGIFAARSSELSARLVYDYFYSHRIKSLGLYSTPEGMGGFIDGVVKFLRSEQVELVLGHEGRLDFAPTDVAVLATRDADETVAADGDLARIQSLLQKIPSVSLTSVTLGFQNDGFSKVQESASDLRGFGCLFPQAEKFHSYGVLFNTDIFPHRGPGWTETFIQPGGDTATDREIIDRALADRARLGTRMYGQGSGPRALVGTGVYRWPRALPLYGFELEALLPQIEAELRRHPRMHLVGNHMGDIGLGKMFLRCQRVARTIKEATL